MKKITSIIAFALFLLAGTGSVFADSTHVVKQGESYYKLGLKYGVSYKKIMERNNAQTATLYVGQKLIIPSTITAEEKDLLARLVEAEAKGEPYAGKVAVATVVLNRVKSDLFPNTIKEVIYEAGQFTPVSNGQINNPATSESIRAVNEALAFEGQGNGSLYFYNPNKTTNQWLRGKQTTIVIGNHIFAK